MEYVKLASPFNSTIFTTCCEVAILDSQPYCPHCGQEVYPGVDATENERRRQRWDMAYTKRKGTRVNP